MIHKDTRDSFTFSILVLCFLSKSTWWGTATSLNLLNGISTLFRGCLQAVMTLIFSWDPDMILRYLTAFHKPVHFLLVLHYELKETLDLHYASTPVTTLLIYLLPYSLYVKRCWHFPCLPCHCRNANCKFKISRCHNVNSRLLIVQD
jgi:hypothetical protein